MLGSYTTIVKDLVSEFGDRYWIGCQDCYLSQITEDIFNKLLKNTNVTDDYVEQFKQLVDLRMPT
jgi:hypothetical protein